MINLRTSEDHRLIQVFVSENGVFEVYIHVELKAFACTCPGYQARCSCKHQRHVRERYEAEQGCYPARLRKGAKPKDTLRLDDNEAWREWIIDNALVEVL